MSSSAPPQGHWLCERAVESLLDPNVCLSDAVFEIGNERHAIEVELSRKSRSALREVIASHSSRYDAIPTSAALRPAAFSTRSLTVSIGQS